MGIAPWVTAKGRACAAIRPVLEATKATDVKDGELVAVELFVVGFTSGSTPLAAALGVECKSGQALEVVNPDLDEALRRWCASFCYRPMSVTVEHFIVLRNNGFSFEYEKE